MPEHQKDVYAGAERLDYLLDNTRFDVIGGIGRLLLQYRISQVR
jgi:hypothetical protein